MENAEQVRSYVDAYHWGGPASALQLHHLKELSRLIKPGDTVLDLACGPGPLLLELAPLYPETKFIGVDLSTLMLDHLRSEAKRRRLDNVEILQEDIRTLPSLNRQVDLIISTSALHHLPSEDDLLQVFQRIGPLIKPDGGFYFFDFALLKSPKTRGVMVRELAKLARPLTVQDYDYSLQAAFPLDYVLRTASTSFTRPYSAFASSFVDFFYFLQTPQRSTCPQSVTDTIRKHGRTLSPAMKMDHLMLRWFRRRMH